MNEPLHRYQPGYVDAELWYCKQCGEPLSVGQSCPKCASNFSLELIRELRNKLVQLHPTPAYVRLGEKEECVYCRLIARATAYLKRGAESPEAGGEGR